MIGVKAYRSAACNRIDHIVLITVDTLRADHLGAYGYPRPTSPFLDWIAAKSVVFDQAIASISSTVPSHSSLFTGLYPLQHGVRSNRLKLSHDLVTAAELLGENGFATAGFVSVGILTASNLRQGFHTFDGPEPGTPHHLYRPASNTIDAVLDWLERDRTTERLFLWVHLFDPHVPHRSDPGDLAALTGAERQTHLDFLLDQHGSDATAFGGDLGRFLEHVEGYDTEIRYVDQQLARLHEALQRTPIQDRAVWIVTADHGEGLGNHGVPGHQRHLYSEQVRVPLIFYFTSKDVRPVRIQQVVRQVDLLPTLLDYAEIHPGSIPYFESMMGQSLLRLIESRPEAPLPSPAFSQRTLYSQHAIRENPGVGTGTKYAWMDRRYKLIHWTDRPDELYDMEADPYETENLLAQDPESTQAHRLRADLLDAIQAMNPVLSSEVEEADSETRRLLKALGYADH
jgi:arylsulfatase A-like enzyme